MGRTDAVAHDPSDRVRRGHLPGFAREEKRGGRRPPYLFVALLAKLGSDD